MLPDRLSKGEEVSLSATEVYFVCDADNIASTHWKEIDRNTMLHVSSHYPIDKLSKRNFIFEVEMPF